MSIQDKREKDYDYLAHFAHNVLKYLSSSISFQESLI
jgi:hypothetical protein